ncbi:iron-sulfur cluster co-chaperone protein HscB, mitochondrial-like isoform X2 [Stylophora pistillata]|uniref:iron-sulfur cluster co-chaperone protein HscB, mitochondrial-like isoform X2 n=1 Tax=Stylophora pistillata TaxID=50429 RepID=UPI000C04EFC4|nr:iron-sulfur cluster co-chaperone protein HscB, mitochondrial-like isoform X2 [Stylophora pistillata]
MFSRRFISPFAVLLPTASSNSNFARRKSWLLLGQYNMYANSVKNKSQTGSRRCWKCNSEIRSGVEFFCPSCNIIQRPPKKATYFELMGSPTSFDIDTKRLTQHYKELQWKLHPDKFSDLSKLNLNGIPITEDEATSTDTKFLGLIMDKYEEISSSEKKLKEIKKENSGDLEKSVRKVSRAFEKGDLETARQEVVKLKYFSKIDEFIKDREGWD